MEEAGVEGTPELCMLTPGDQKKTNQVTRQTQLHPKCNVCLKGEIKSDTIPLLCHFQNQLIMLMHNAYFLFFKIH